MLVLARLVGLTVGDPWEAALPIGVVLTPDGLPVAGAPLDGVPVVATPPEGVPVVGLPLDGVLLVGVLAVGLPLVGVPLVGVPLVGVPLVGLLPGGVPVLAPVLHEHAVFPCVLLAEVCPELLPDELAVEPAA